MLQCKLYYLHTAVYSYHRRLIALLIDSPSAYSWREPAMPETAEAIEPIPDQASAHQKKRQRTIFIFCAVSAFNVALFALFWTQLLTPATHPAPAPLVGQPAPNFSLALLHPAP